MKHKTRYFEDDILRKYKKPTEVENVFIVEISVAFSHDQIIQYYKFGVWSKLGRNDQIKRLKCK